MKHTNQRELNLKNLPPKEYNLNKSSTGCVPCLKEASKIDRKINNRSLTEIKIDEIKSIVKSILSNILIF